MRVRRIPGFGRDGVMGHTHDRDLDLLTAALIGAAVGVTATLLIRPGSSGRRPLMTGLSMAGRGARWAGMAGLAGAQVAGREAMKRARRGVKRGTELMEELPLDNLRDQLRDYLDAAKGAIEDTVREELQDLRKSVRRRRKRFGM
jgi:hypothetical protein